MTNTLPNTWLKIERHLLTNIWENVETELFSTCNDQLVSDLKHVINGDYALLIESRVSSDFAKDVNRNNFKELIWSRIENNEASKMQWFLCGASSLLYFVQTNWTGPVPVEEFNSLKSLKDEALNDLNIQDGCNENVTNLEALYLAKVIFGNHELQKNFHTSIWWLFRANLLHQIVLEEPCSILFDLSEDLIDKILKMDIYNDNVFKTLFNLEAAYFYFYFKRIQSSARYLEEAGHTAALSIQLEGALGKRTKYQQQEKAQLYLNVKLGKEKFPSKEATILPNVQNLSDDVRLEQIHFTEDIEKVDLGAVEEAVILANFFQMQLSQPKDELQIEELSPYLNIIIENTKNWPLKMSALSQRCVLESSHKRTVERALCQMEYLLQKIENSESPLSNRVDLFFSSGMKPIWRLKQILADLMLSIGMVKGALDLYLNLFLWEEVIVCYTLLNLRHKAAEIIQNQLDKKPTVKLWCLLGDATQEEKHYETAWKLSGEKSSRAQRHWGFFHFSKQNYKEAVPHLRLSVELNNIQENVWIRLGYAAMYIEDWNLAASSYRSYCALEQSNFEVWNNLAKAYIKLGDKPRAWRALHDAIKCNFDRWEVWDNLKVVSVDIGHFTDVIRCYHRILDLKGVDVDVEVLTILTQAIVSDIKDADGNPSRNLLQKTLELFGRLTSAVPNNSDIWKLYAELTFLKGTELDNQKAAQFLQRAYRAAVSNPRWFQTIDEVRKVIATSVHLAEVSLVCTRNCADSQKRSILGSAKLSLSSAMKKITDQEWGNQMDELNPSLNELEDKLNLVKNEIDQINSI